MKERCVFSRFFYDPRAPSVVPGDFLLYDERCLHDLRISDEILGH
jgi:hypothetical protein